MIENPSVHSLSPTTQAPATRTYQHTLSMQDLSELCEGVHTGDSKWVRCVGACQRSMDGEGGQGTEAGMMRKVMSA